jgi:hypothetical protein
MTKKEIKHLSPLADNLDCALDELKYAIEVEIGLQTDHFASRLDRLQQVLEYLENMQKELNIIY